MADEERMAHLMEMSEAAIDHVCDAAAEWQQDESDDILARGIIAGVRPLIEALPASLKADGVPSTLMTALFVEHFMHVIGVLNGLDAIAQMKNNR